MVIKRWRRAIEKWCGAHARPFCLVFERFDSAIAKPRRDRSGIYDLTQFKTSIS